MMMRMRMMMIVVTWIYCSMSYSRLELRFDNNDPRLREWCSCNTTLPTSLLTNNREVKYFEDAGGFGNHNEFGVMQLKRKFTLTCLTVLVGLQRLISNTRSSSRMITRQNAYAISLN